MQAINIAEAVDISQWEPHQEYGTYPEGARDKTLLYCPDPAPYPFLRPNHLYLFKQSSRRYLEQFWVEIFAYRLGIVMDVIVPPAFAGYQHKNRQSGALIEWFLETGVDNQTEEHILGGDYCQRYLPDFDRKTGRQHNFETVAQIFDDLTKNEPHPLSDWKSYWAKIFIFDALIGNTDRHQDNWGIIVLNPYNQIVRISPVFDNGTSMGHEILSTNLQKFDQQKLIEKYVENGRHHIRWHPSDTHRSSHSELHKLFVGKYPETQQVMLNCLNMVNYESFKTILNDLVAYNAPGFNNFVRLSPDRAAFMLKLLQYRHQRLVHELDR